MNLDNRNNIFVFIGPPGSGKGTFSTLCIKKFGWEQLSTGNLCRKHIADKTEIGKHIDFIIKSGKLVSDDIIFEMVKGWLIEQVDANKSVILDGYPRNILQAKALESLLSENKFSKVGFHIVEFKVPDDIVLQRLTGRLVCKNKNCQTVYSSIKDSGLQPKVDFTCDKCSTGLEIRSDDNPQTVRERLRVYHEHANSLLNFYREKKRNIIELDASMSVEKSFDRLKGILGL